MATDSAGTNMPSAFPILPNEAERLAALQSYHILDTAEEKDFDDLTLLASAICQTPVALVSLVDKDRQWFKSHKGTEVTETPKEQSFCAHAIASPEPIMIIGDASKDARFANNPLVTGDPHIAFYAGVPLVNSDGFGLGSLCVIDTQVRELSSEQINALIIIAKQVVDKLEQRRNQKRLEEINGQLVKSENRFRNLVSQAPVAITIYSGPNLVIEQANQYMLQLLGRTDEIIGMPLLKARPELVGHPYLDTIKEVIQSGNEHVGKGVKAPIRQDNQVWEGYFDVTYKPLKDEDGQVTGVIVVATDVTDQTLSRQREEQMTEELAAMNEELMAANEELTSSQEFLTTMNENLFKSQSRFRGLIEQSPVAIASLKNRDLVIEIANDMILELWGKNAGVIGKPLQVAIPELQGQPFLQLLDDVFTSGKPYHGNEASVVLEQNGKPKQLFVNFVYQPIIDTRGNTTEIMVVANDVTEQVNARKIIEEAEKKFRLMADNISQLAWMADANGYIFWYNQRWFDYTNTTLEEMQGWGWQKVHHPDHVDRVVEKIAAHFASGEVWEDEFPLRGIDGEYRWFLSRAVPTKNVAGEVISWFGTNTDVTEQENIRLTLNQKNEELSLLAEQLAYVSNAIPQQVWTATPDGMLDFVNEQTTQYFGKTSAELVGEKWLAVVHPDDLEPAGKAWGYSLTTGEPYQTEFRLLSKNNTYIWHLARAVAFKEDGHIIKWFGTNTDIDGHKQLEQHKSDFISIASHELKTPLTSLKGTIQLLDRIKDKPAEPMMPRLIEQANRGMQKITSLVEDLLSVSRMQDGQLHLNKTNFRATALLKESSDHALMQGYEMVMDGDTNAALYADEHLIEQVIINFVNNAIKYAPKAKKIYLQVQPGTDQIKIAVKDEGPGITADKLPHLFDRYYRVDHSGRQYSGLGLGLYICSEIIKKHGGQIGVDSEIDKGSTFWFTLPVSF